MAAQWGTQAWIDAMRLQGPRSSILARCSDHHYRVSGIRLAAVQAALIQGELARNPNVAAPEPYDDLPIAITRPLVHNDRLVFTAVRRVSTSLASLFHLTSETTGNLTEHLEGVVRVFARVGLLLVASAINESPALMGPLAAADFTAPGVINPATECIGYHVEFNYSMRRPANIGGRADTLLLRRTQVAANRARVRAPAVRPGNYYVPLCFLEVKHFGPNLLDAGLAECLIAAAVNGHTYGLASVVGVVTNLQEWRFLIVEAGAIRVSAVQNLDFDGNNEPVRDPTNYGPGSLDSIVAAMVLLCLGRGLVQGAAP